MSRDFFFFLYPLLLFDEIFILLNVLLKSSCKILKNLKFLR